MPLIIITGIPSSGKSIVTKMLEEYFTNKYGKKVHIISENDLILQEKNTIYSDSQKEKILRSEIKSAALRYLNNEDLIIIDALSYIKGFRYELYCASKQHKTPHCLVQILTPIDRAWQWNESREGAAKYSKEVFDALIMRSEAPDSRNRWDSPMFTVIPTEGEVPFQSLYAALYERAPPPPNQSTQLQPLTSNNFLHELDKCTQDVVSSVLEIQKTNPEGEIKVPHTTENLTLSRKVTLAELSRMRRQFITYTKAHPVDDLERIRTLFVQYLNKTINLD